MLFREFCWLHCSPLSCFCPSSGGYFVFAPRDRSVLQAIFGICLSLSRVSINRKKEREKERQRFLRLPRIDHVPLCGWTHTHVDRALVLSRSFFSLLPRLFLHKSSSSLSQRERAPIANFPPRKEAGRRPWRINATVVRCVCVGFPSSCGVREREQIETRLGLDWTENFAMRCR